MQNDNQSGSHEKIQAKSNSAEKTFAWALLGVIFSAVCLASFSSVGVSDIGVSIGPAFFIFGTLFVISLAAMFFSGLGMLAYKASRPLGFLIVFVSLILFIYGYFKAHQDEWEIWMANRHEPAILKAIEERKLSVIKKELFFCGAGCRRPYSVELYVGKAFASQSEEIFDYFMREHHVEMQEIDAQFLLGEKSCRGDRLWPNALQVAVLLEKPKTLNVLLKYATQEEKNSLLWLAVQANRVDYAERLLKAGAQLKTTDIRGYTEEDGRSGTLFKAALDGKSPSTFDWLLKHGLSPKVMIDGGNWIGEMPMLSYWAMLADEEDEDTGAIGQSEPLLDILVKVESNVKYQSYLTKFARGNKEVEGLVVLRALLDKGVDLTDANGHGIYDMAYIRRYTDDPKWLAQHETEAKNKAKASDPTKQTLCAEKILAQKKFSF